MPGIVAAGELLEATGLAGFRHAYPQRLSIGMTRRVALVRAFAVMPDLLLLDEPFVSLDEPTAQRLRQLLLDIWERTRRRFCSSRRIPAKRPNWRTVLSFSRRRPDPSAR
jgi:ABC-type nitrate/sulfonate/bicarbonate transport system ATPase subunit